VLEGQPQYTVQQMPGTSLGTAGHVPKSTVGGGRLTNGVGGYANPDIVKSMLSQPQYGQSILRPELLKGTAAAQQQTKAVAQQPQGRQGQQQSLLNPNLKQQQSQMKTESVENSRQLVATGNYGIPAGHVKDEGIYQIVQGGVTYHVPGSVQGGVTYHVPGPLVSQEGFSVDSDMTCMSLQDLANVSASQDQLDYTKMEVGETSQSQTLTEGSSQDGGMSSMSMEEYYVSLGGVVQIDVEGKQVG